MSDTGIIGQRKQLFNLPMKENEIEFWGPINYDFSNSFLSMGNAFLSGNEKLNKKKRKSFFTSFVELVQNIAKYNETKAKDFYVHAYVSLKMLDNKIILRTANQIDVSYIGFFKTKLDQIFSIPKSELPDKYKDALMQGKSLGLIMVRSLEDSTLTWEIDDDGKYSWVIFNLEMNYGKKVRDRTLFADP